MSLRNFLRSVPGLLLACTCLGQSTYQITGSTVNSKTSEPVRGALVTLTRLPTGESTVRADLFQTLTGPGGTFLFSQLPAGSYILSAQKPGFEATPQDYRRPLEVGPSRDGVALRLAPLAKVFGRVTDRGGEPIAWAAVQLVQSMLSDGRRSFHRARSVTSDDLGRYRCWDLPPGTYFAVAAGRGGGTQLSVGHTVTAPNSHEGFAPTYHGGAVSRTSATPINLTAGQDVEANIEVTLQPAFRLRGSLRNFKPYQQVRVELLRGGQEDAGANRTSVNSATGQFEVQDLVPGSYLLRASQGAGETELRGQRTIQVAADMDGIILDLAPGVDVIAHIPPPAGTDQHIRHSGTIRLEPADSGSTPRQFSARPEPDGTTVIHGVFPGRYRVVVTPFGGYVSSVRSGNTDLLNGGELLVAPGAAPAAIEVTLSADGGSVRATTATADISPTILFVPTSGADPLIFRYFPPDFELGNLPPGDYQIYLLKDASSIEYRNPEVLRMLHGGQAVHVTARSTTAVDLKEVAQ